MHPENWADAVEKFQRRPDYAAFLELTEVLPFEIMVQYPLMDESANDFVSTILPVIDSCLEIEEVFSHYVVLPTVTRICQLSDYPINEPTMRDGNDRFEEAEKFVGLVRGWAYAERYPDRRCYLDKVLLTMIRITGAISLCVPDVPSLRKGLDAFEEWICGLWLNMLDAENPKIAANVTDILTTVRNTSSASEIMIPKARMFSAAVLTLSNFDDNLSRWLKDDLSSDEKDVVHQWATGLPSALLARVRGEATLLGCVDKDSCKIRAAIALIRLSDLSPSLTKKSAEENWCVTIIDQLYFSNDPLMKLAAGEVILEEILRSEETCSCLYRNNILFRIIEDLETIDASDVETASRSSIRLIANVFEKVPGSREVISEYPKFIGRVRSLLLDRHGAFEDQAIAISCVGAIMSGLNHEGLKLIAAEIPEWKAAFESAARLGDEHITTALIMALTRIAGGIHSTTAVEPDPANESDYKELRDKVLRTLDQELTPILITQTYPKPFPTVRVFIFQFFELMMALYNLVGSVECYASTPRLMEQLFDCPSDKLHTVVMARHHYIRKIRVHYTFKDKTFEEAVEYCVNHGPYEKPPLFHGESAGPVVIDQAAQ